MADELKSLNGTTLPEKFVDKTTYSARVIDTTSTKNYGVVDSTTTRVVMGEYTTYASSFTIVPAAAATDFVEIIGAANKIIEVVSIRIGGTLSATLSHKFFLIKRSAVNTGGTSTSQTITPLDSTSAACSATIKAYTANPAGLGTAVGTVMADYFTFQSAASTGYRSANEFFLNCHPSSQPVTLLSATQTLCINLDGASPSTPSFEITVTLREYT